MKNTGETKGKLIIFLSRFLDKNIPNPWEDMGTFIKEGVYPYTKLPIISIPLDSEEEN